MSDAGFGETLRRWRAARGMSQQRLAEGAEVSTRHVSFLETGRARPSREMVLVLANALELPLRARNALLQTAGFASVYRESAWESPAMAHVERALEHILRAHEPFGAVVVDRAWNVRRMNDGAVRLFTAFWPDGAPPPVNVVRATFDPAARAAFEDWEALVAELVPRYRREAATCPELAALLDEALAGAQVPEAALRAPFDAPLGPTLVFTLRKGPLRARVFTTLTSLGTPLDVTAEDVRIESYFPADAESEALMRRLAADAS